MQKQIRIDWAWLPRPQALEPQAAVAWGSAAQRLHHRISQMPAETLAQLSATANAELLFVSGPSDLLPWVDGIEYAAPCPSHPVLWLPTHRQPNVPVELLVRALLQQHNRQPLLIWPQPTALIPLDRLLPLSTEHLARISSHWKDI